MTQSTRIALVTGASRGLGLVIARVLAKRGYGLVIGGRDREALAESATALAKDAPSVLPVAGDICVEADSGGHTDAGSPYALMPAMTRLRDELMARHSFWQQVRVGAAGGIGSPEAAAAAFTLGADFVLTGSVNQCSVEAGTSDAAKELLEQVDVQDTAYAPAGDMFELGRQSRKEHRELGRAVARGRIQQLYLLGRQAKDVSDGARSAGMSAMNIIIGKSHGDLAERLREQARSGDWLLLKGSRGMKMERVLDELKGGEA